MATTTVAAVPFTLKDVSLVIGPTATAYEFKTAVSSVTFTPSATAVTWQGLGSNTFTDTSVASWTCDLEYAQDWATANSLSKYLFTNEGSQVQAVFKPQSAGTPSVTVTLVITPGAIGGTVNQVATATVSLGVVGKPVLA